MAGHGSLHNVSHPLALNLYSGASYFFSHLFGKASFIFSV